MIRDFLRELYEGPLAVQLRRFVIVGTVAAGVQMVLLWAFVEFGELNYLLGALIAIEITIIFQYVLNNAWTFETVKNIGAIAYLVGLLKTNVVRGTAIPIQIGILYVLVAWGNISYLIANVIAIGISGIYRFIFDSMWTWRMT